MSEQVVQILQDNGLGHHAKTFMEHGIDGKALVQLRRSHTVPQELGLFSQAERLRLYAVIERISPRYELSLAEVHSLLLWR
jgi:hypothetical protein